MDLLSNYDVVMVQRKGNFQAYAKDLHLFGFGDTPDNAIAMIEQKYQALLSDLEDAGFSENVTMPQPSAATKSLDTTFLIKLASGVVAVLIIFYSANLVINSFINKFEQTAYSLSESVSLRPLLKKLRIELVTINERSPEQQLEMLNEVRYLVGILKPYVNEIVPLFGKAEMCD